MKNTNFQTIPSTSVTPSFNGAAIDTGQMLYISAQAITSGSSSPVFTVKLQASNDICTTGNQPTPFVPTNWTDIPNATVSVSANGSTMIPKTEICYRWVRVVVTFASGTGNVAVNIFGICV
jgi:hypothetical protein